MKTRQAPAVRFCNVAGLPFLPFGSAGLVLLAATSVAAQMHHVDAPQRVTRAVGVYEWTGDLTKPTAARFVPVSLFIDGRFEDAGLYLARPVPFALQPGDLYALERSGEPQGTLDLDLAHRVVTGKALDDDNTLGAWYAFGRFTPQSAPKPTALKPSSHPSRLEQSAGPNTPAGAKLPSDDGADNRPHMTRRDGGSTGSGSTSSTGPTGSTGSTGTTSTASTGASSNSDDDTDRPTLRRRDPSQDAARRREASSRSKTASVSAAGPALGDDPDRPILGHNTADTASTPELTGLPADLHQAVAVSDATHNDNHPFAREWESPSERADTLSAMAALARTRLAEYLAANQLVASNASLPAVDAATASQASASQTPTGKAGPKLYDDTIDAAAPPKLQRGVPRQGAGASASNTAGSGSDLPPNATSASSGSESAAASGSPAKSAVHKAAVHPAAGRISAHPKATHAAALALVHEEVSGFTLSYGGLPTFVYSAAASVAKTGASQTPPEAAYVTVVAQRLASGELQVALSAATDSAHLDRGPRLRLVDAVDPDDSHRASLLFELRSRSSRQFALYRLTSARAEQTFTTASIE